MEKTSLLNLIRLEYTSELVALQLELERLYESDTDIKTRVRLIKETLNKIANIEASMTTFDNLLLNNNNNK